MEFRWYCPDSDGIQTEFLRNFYEAATGHIIVKAAMADCMKTLDYKLEGQGEIFGGICLGIDIFAFDSSGPSQS